MSGKMVGLWRRRWRDSFSALLRMQFMENDAAFRRAIIESLSDAPRRGSPGKFTAKQIVGLIGIACEPPENSGRAVTSWTGKELADESKKRGLVDSISASHVNRILREVDLQPHKSRYWCNTTEKDPELFQQQVEIVCQTYLDAPMLYHQFNTHTVCVDEMTSLQANERRAETKLLQPGQTTLGAAKKEGVLKTMVTRRTFLSDPSRRIRLVYIPKHSSWLNQIEIIFGIINRRVMRRDSLTSKFDLIEKLKHFMNYFNETIAQPMNWTYTGRPTRNTPSKRPRTWRELRQAKKPWKELALVGTNL